MNISHGDCSGYSQLLQRTEDREGCSTVVSASDTESEGRGFDFWSLPHIFFIRKGALLSSFSPHPGVMNTWLKNR